MMYNCVNFYYCYYYENPYILNHLQSLNDGGDWLKVLAAGLLKLRDRMAAVMECSDGRHLVRVVPLIGGGKAYSEWLCGDDYLEWVRCLQEKK